MSSQHVVAAFVRQPRFLQELTEVLADGGLAAHPVSSSEDLHRMLDRDRIDALVIEHELGGFLSGLEILERLREELIRPVTVLLGDLTAEDRSRAAALKVDHVFPPTDGPGRICESLRASLQTATHTGLRIPAAARQLVLRADAIRPMPQLVVKIAGYLNDEDASIPQLARDIATDPRITAELLKLTNSAAFGLQNKVRKVLDAVSYLGIRRTASLVLSAAVHRAQGDMRAHVPDELLGWFRSRSVLEGSVAAAFAERLHGVSPDSAYVLGLLQDLGILALVHELGDPYVKLLERGRTIPHLNLVEVERQEMSFCHADVSAALLQKWELPASMVGLVLEHHGDPNEDQSATEQHFLQAMKVGEAVANMRDVPSPQRHMILRRLFDRYGANRQVDVKGCFAEAIAKATEASELFNVPVPGGQGWQQLLSRMQHDLDGDGPAPPAEADDPPPEVAPEPASPPKPPTLLVVDDEEPIGKLVAVFLKAEDLVVDFRTELPDVAEVGPNVVGILCDVHLRETSGVDFVRALRAAGVSTPVLMISGDRTRNTVTRSISAGVVDYIPKPFNREMLLERLRKHGMLASASSAATAHA